MPLGFGAPLIIGVLPRALCGDREHGELRTVAFRLTLPRVRTNKPDESYGIDKTFFYLFFLPRFLLGTRESEGTWSRRLASALWEGLPTVSGVAVKADDAQARAERNYPRGERQSNGEKKERKCPSSEKVGEREDRTANDAVRGMRLVAMSEVARVGTWQLRFAWAQHRNIVVGRHAKLGVAGQPVGKTGKDKSLAIGHFLGDVENKLAIAFFRLTQ
jgi:hypothetical protein